MNTRTRDITLQETSLAVDFIKQKTAETFASFGTEEQLKNYLERRYRNLDDWQELFGSTESVGKGVFCGDRLLGIACADAREGKHRNNPGGAIYFGDFRVEPGLSLGSRLMKELLDWSRLRDEELLFAEVAESNIRALRLFEKFGFKVCGSHLGRTFGDLVWLELYRENA